MILELAAQAPPDGGAEGGVAGGAAAALGAVRAQQATEDAAAARKMLAVCDFVDLHRVDDLLDAAVDPEVLRAVADADGHGEEAELRLAGEGTFMVSEFAVTELAAALRMSEPAARGYVGQSVELRDRLPRLWSRVMTGQLPAWKARLVAKETLPLSEAAAGYVDVQLAPFAHRISPWRILRAVEAAVLRHEPELAEARAAAAADKRGVWVEDRLDGTSEVRAVTDTPDAQALDHAVDRVAATLRALGDTESRDARRAKAVGVLADPQFALDLQTAADSGDPRRLPTRRPLHIHLHTDAVERRLPPGEGGVARVEGLGARSLAAVRRWLNQATPGSELTLTPVVDLTERISVDAYEAPDRLRAQVEHRETCCSFPWCGGTGRFDLDHIEPYRSRDDGGPPGQTSSAGLARLCRYHHRVKTHPGRHGHWRYFRHPDGGLHWTSPLGNRYRVDHTGTTDLP